MNLHWSILMKKDKEQHQPVLESITADEPKTSSIALALQQFRKEAEKKRLLRKVQKYAAGLVLKKSHLSAFVPDMAQVVAEVIVPPLIRRHLRKKRVLVKLNS